MAAQLQSKFIDVAGLRVHYLEAGAGSPVILLHGGGLDSASLSYGPSIALIAQAHRVIAPDLPGYGETAGPKVAYTTACYVDFLAHFMDALGLARASLVGLSLGGAVALGLALQAPERVDRLVLVDSHGLGREYPYGCLGLALVHLPLANELTWRSLARNKGLVRSSLKGIVYSPDVVTDDLVEEVYQLLQRPGAGAAWRSWQRSEIRLRGIRTDYSARLPEVAAPTLILHGEGDTLVPLAWAERAQRLIPNARLEVFPEVRHWLPREKPAELAQRVLEFLAW